MKRLLIPVAVLAVALFAGLLVPATSGAAVPCRDRIFNDWYHDGRVASSYPTSCYRDALKHIPTDAKIYSSLSTDIKSAMLASLRRQHGKPAPKQVGHGLRIVGHSGVDGQLVSIGDPKTGSASEQASGSPGAPGATSSGELADTASSGTPLPILLLGGLALALAGAGAIGGGVRYARRRR
jgi:hypothetical protein